VVVGYLPEGSYQEIVGPCTGSLQPWTLTVFNMSANATFVPGPALMFGDACDNGSNFFDCLDYARTITLPK
jgi:hypothetical protein